MIHCKHKRSRTPLVAPSLEKYLPPKILYLSFQNYATDNKIFRNKYYLIKLHNISTTHIKSLPSSKLYLQISHLRQLGFKWAHNVEYYLQREHQSYPNLYASFQFYFLLSFKKCFEAYKINSMDGTSQCFVSLRKGVSGKHGNCYYFN